MNLRDILRFSGLNHQCAGDREGHGRGMEAVIHESLSNIVDGNAGVFS